jgi:hypothetical protein
LSDNNLQGPLPGAGLASMMGITKVVMSGNSDMCRGDTTPFSDFYCTDCNAAAPFNNNDCVTCSASLAAGDGCQPGRCNPARLLASIIPCLCDQILTLYFFRFLPYQVRSVLTVPSTFVSYRTKYVRFLPYQVRSFHTVPSTFVSYRIKYVNRTKNSLFCAFLRSLPFQEARSPPMLPRVRCPRANPQIRFVVQV